MKEKKYILPYAIENWKWWKPIIRNIWGALEQRNEKEDKLF